MSVKLIFSLKVLYTLLETTSSQYNYQDNIMPHSMYQYQIDHAPIEYDIIDEIEDYDNKPRGYYRRSSHKHRPYGSSGGKLPRLHYKYDESEECRCTCIRCDDQDPCCKDLCTNCDTQDNRQSGQANLVFVPYPYPVIVTPKVIDREKKESSTETTTNSPTTKITTTTTKPTVATSPEKESESIETRRLFNGKNEYSDLESDLKPRYMLTPVRRVKPAWLPKYGIISLPNNLAQMLMSKLRNVKKLQNPRTLI